jgi:hypothetical protein
MEDRAPAVSSVSEQSLSQQSLSQQSLSQQSLSNRHHEGRGAWVLTAYGISGLALFGVLAYFFSDFIAH